jgi:hypothetical protein
VEFAASARAEAMQVQASAPKVAPTAASLSNAQELRDRPAAARNAATTGVIGNLKTSAAPANARALFYSNVLAAGRGGRGAGFGGGGIGAGAAGGFRPMPEQTTTPAGHLGIQYRILRKTAGGEFVETDAAATGSVAAGTLFKLQITTNDSGYVRVLQETPDGAWRGIVNHAVERMQAIETEPIEIDQPGRVRFHVAFARQPLPQSNVAQPDDDIVVDRGLVVTVAGRAAAAQQLSFNITLIIQ